jgi:hypothetical protein
MMDGNVRQRRKRSPIKKLAAERLPAVRFCSSIRAGNSRQAILGGREERPERSLRPFRAVIALERIR